MTQEQGLIDHKSILKMYYFIKIFFSMPRQRSSKQNYIKHCIFIIDFYALLRAYYMDKIHYTFWQKKRKYEGFLVFFKAIAF